MLRLAMFAVSCALAYTASIMLKVNGISPRGRDFWIIVVSSGLATLLAFHSATWKRDKKLR